MGRRTIFGSTAPQVSLDEEFPGLPQVVPSTAPTAPSTQVTTLGNGVRVVSHDDQIGAASTFGIVLGGGPRAETDAIRGASHLISKMAFVQRSHNNTGLRIVRGMEEAGGKGWSGVTRESLFFAGSCLRSNVDLCAHSVAEVALHSAFRPWDVAEGREMLRQDLAHSVSSEDRLADALFQAAFYDTHSLGKSTMACPSNLDNLSGDALSSFMERLCDASNVVVSGVGVSHDQLVAIAEATCGHLSSGGDGVNGERAEYVGGEARLRSNGDGVTCSLAFPTPGGNDATPYAVLAEVLGSGSVYTKGRGFGHGSTRLGKAVRESGFIRNAQGFAHVFSDAGLVGVTSETYADQGAQSVDFAIAQLKGIASGGVSEAECNAAKARLRLKRANVSNAARMGSNASQVLSTGSVESDASAVDNVTPASVQAAAQCVNQFAPTIASEGNLAALPRYNAVQALCK